MKPRFAVLIAIALLLGACRNNSSMKRGQQNYDVVQEGDTSGSVTSTISGPGETPPPSPINAPPTTATNTDNTNAFALPGTTTETSGSMAQQQPSSIGGTMPAIPAPDHIRVTRPRRTTTTTTNTSTVATDTAAIPPTTTTQEPLPPEPTQTTTTTTATTTTPPPPPPTDTSHPPL